MLNEYPYPEYEGRRNIVIGILATDIEPNDSGG